MSIPPYLLHYEYEYQIARHSKLPSSSLITWHALEKLPPSMLHEAREFAKDGCVPRAVTHAPFLPRVFQQYCTQTTSTSAFNFH
jgi:hypothetical protein